LSFCYRVASIFCLIVPSYLGYGFWFLPISLSVNLSDRLFHFARLFLAVIAPAFIS
jgi:hypothetical protein